MRERHRVCVRNAGRAGQAELQSFLQRAARRAAITNQQGDGAGISLVFRQSWSERSARFATGVWPAKQWDSRLWHISNHKPDAHTDVRQVINIEWLVNADRRLSRSGRGSASSHSRRRRRDWSNEFATSDSQRLKLRRVAPSPVESNLSQCRFSMPTARQ